MNYFNFCDCNYYLNLCSDNTYNNEEFKNNDLSMNNIKNNDLSMNNIKNNYLYINNIKKKCNVKFNLNNNKYHYYDKNNNESINNNILYGDTNLKSLPSNNMIEYTIYDSNFRNNVLNNNIYKTDSIINLYDKITNDKRDIYYNNYNNLETNYTDNELYVIDSNNIYGGTKFDTYSLTK